MHGLQKGPQSGSGSQCPPLNLLQFYFWQLHLSLQLHSVQWVTFCLTMLCRFFFFLFLCSLPLQLANFAVLKTASWNYPVLGLKNPLEPTFVETT